MREMEKFEGWDPLFAKKNLYLKNYMQIKKYPYN